MNRISSFTMRFEEDEDDSITLIFESEGGSVDVNLNDSAAGALSNFITYFDATISGDVTWTDPDRSIEGKP